VKRIRRAVKRLRVRRRVAKKIAPKKKAAKRPAKKAAAKKPAKRASAPKASSAQSNGGENSGALSRVTRVAKELAQQTSTAVTEGVEKVKEMGGSIVERVTG